MIRRLAIALVVLAAGVVLVLATGAASGGGGYQVRAIFDNASFVIPGEDVKVAGVKVGKVGSLEVTPDKKAAVVLNITQPGFEDFRRDARCTIRPQSLIGEQFVECTPTVPTREGQRRAPALAVIANGKPGAGQRLLPLQNRYGGGTSSPVGIDLINDTLRLPERQRLSLIINELGTGLAGNGEELRQVIRRANPALRELDKVLAVLASENRQLADLARNGDTVLRPLARDRRRVQSFITNARVVAQATAERRDDLARDVQRLPTFLAELRPTAARLGQFADAGTPVLAELGRNAPAVNGLIRELGPFSAASLPAFRALGDAARTGIPAMRDSRPLARDLNRLGQALQPAARTARKLLVSVRDTGGLEQILNYTFFQLAAINGHDDVGHYLRAGLLQGDFLQNCGLSLNTAQATNPGIRRDCRATFTDQPPVGATAAAARASRSTLVERLRAVRAGAGRSSPNASANDSTASLLQYLVGGGKR